MMNIRDLDYLLAVAKLKHFGKAANSCNVSQPALSMQIHKLEEELGVKLFERSYKPICLTNAGLEIVKRATKVQQNILDIKEIAKSYQNPFAGEIKLGVFPTLAPFILPHIVPAISKVMPQLRQLLVEEKTDQLLDGLLTGNIDAALLALPVEETTLDYIILFEDKFFLAVSPHHHLVKVKNIALSDLENECILLLQEGHCLRDQALSICEQSGIPHCQDFRATSIETLRQMVATGIGITMMPSMAIKAKDNIVYIPIKDASFKRTIALVWRKSSVRIECIKRIAAIIKKVSLHINSSSPFVGW